MPRILLDLAYKQKQNTPSSVTIKIPNTLNQTKESPVAEVVLLTPDTKSIVKFIGSISPLFHNYYNYTKKKKTIVPTYLKKI